MAKAMEPGKVKAKKKCCKAKTRCKRCAVVMTRLEKKGYAERVDKRNFLVLERVPKKALKPLRAR